MPSRRRSRSSTSTRTRSSRCRADASYSWEHLDFQQGAKAHPALKKKFVRQAIIQGINRAQIREVLYVKTGLVPNQKDLPVLQSNIFKPFEAAYADAVHAVGLQPEEHHRALKKNGCTGGPDTPSCGQLEDLQLSRRR